MRKPDLLLIALLLGLSFLPLLLLGKTTNTDARYAEITVDGKLYRRLPLTNHQEQEDIPVDTPKGHNLIRLENGTIAVIAADCPDKICIKTGPMKKAGNTIACLPHKLLIEVKEGPLP